MNAYELYDSAFDSACDEAEDSIKYIQDYAEGAFNVYVSDEVALKILACKAECRAATDENGEGQNNRYHYIQVPLEQIEL